MGMGAKFVLISVDKALKHSLEGYTVLYVCMMMQENVS